jgi:hypothetical protein
VSEDSITLQRDHLPLVFLTGNRNRPALSARKARAVRVTYIRGAAGTMVGIDSLYMSSQYCVPHHGVQADNLFASNRYMYDGYDYEGMPAHRIGRLGGRRLELAEDQPFGGV